MKKRWLLGAHASRVAAVAIVLALTSTTVASASVAPVHTPRSKVHNHQPVNTWPEYSHDPQLSGVSPDTAISTANASSLGVAWMANMGASALGSPVVAWNAEVGTTLIYTSNEAGYLTAFDAATQEPVWSVSFGAGMRSTPLVEGNYLWVAPTSAHRIYKLDAGTGAVQCSAPLEFNTDASPTIGTPPGGLPTIYEGVNDLGPNNGPMTAVDEATCSVDFSVNQEPVSGTGGIWDPASYAVDAQGEGLVVYGTADPDAAVYAIDAITGNPVWRYATDNPAPHTFDVGAGITISPPGVNGFADGVAYAVNKAGYLVALDLTTGALIWSVRYAATISTPDLVGSDLVYGDGRNVTCLNATTGALVWKGGGTSVIDGALTVVGPPGSQVVAYGDMSGVVHVRSMATGAPLFTYQTGNFIVTDVAEYDGNLVVAGADGFLYDFAPGGGTGPAPSTAVTTPSAGSTVANPGGDVTIAGTAGTSSGPAVGAVSVAIQEGGASGQWWDSATGTWVAAPYGNPATLDNPGASTSGWMVALPVPQAGGSYEVFASATGTNAVADVSDEQSAPTPSRSSFTVSPSTSAPTLTVSSPWVAPGTSPSATGAGFEAGEQVTLQIAGTPLATATTDGSGNLPATPFTVPKTFAFGPTSLVATGQTSGLSTSTPLYITNSWSQYRSTFNRVGSEPNDSVLANRVSVSVSTFLTQAWSFNSAAPISSSPAVTDAVAYFGNTAGQFYAVNVTTGMQDWSYADSNAIDTSAAVDPATGGGLVIFGDEGGQLVALSTSNGSVVWTSSLGSAIESSPAISRGVVYVGSDSGVLYALNETTGGVIWQTTLAGAIHSSPAVDAMTKRVVVGDDSGAVTALATTTGAVEWSVATSPSPLAASPIIANNTVFIGSGGGTFYALAEATGAQKWATTLSNPITGSAALTGVTLYVPNGNQVVSLNSKSGVQGFTQTFSTAVVGVSSTLAFSVTETTGGTVTGSKGPGKSGWGTTLPSGLASSPTIINGEVFITGEDGMLHCYTVPGEPAV